MGSISGNVPAGCPLPLYAEFRAARRGIAHIYVVRNNLEEMVFRRSGSFSPGQVTSWQDTLIFPGGRQSYWLYFAGSDYPYSGPIFASEGHPCIRED